MTVHYGHCHWSHALYQVSVRMLMQKRPLLLPHRHRTKLQAYSHTDKNYKPVAKQSTELQAYSHTGVIQNYKLAATQATKLQALCPTGVKTIHMGILNWNCILATPQTKFKKKLHAYCSTGLKDKITKSKTLNV